MDLKRLRELLGDAEKVIVVENDEPVMIITSLRPSRGRKETPREREQEAPQSPAAVLMRQRSSEGELTIDDLPL